jgi:hypothetical protein
MNANVQFMKMLALMPVVALAVACGNSATPGGSTSLPSGNLATESGDASTMSIAPACIVTSVSLRTDDQTSRSMIWIQALYVPSQPTLEKCPAPSWTADRKGLVVDSANPFRAGYPRNLTGVVNVTATAPNGARNSIRVDLGGGTDFAAPPSNEACRRIEDISLRVVPVTGLQVRVQAQYAYTRPTTANVCTVTPKWTASRTGLTADGFFANIDRQPLGRTMVTATAPNGVSRSLTF